MSRLDALRGNPWPGLTWRREDLPVLVLDGTLHRIANLDGRLMGRIAMVVDVNEAAFRTVCQSLTVESLQFYLMRVDDLSPISKMESLQALAISWNTKLTRLSGLAGLRSLESLLLENTPRLRDLTALSSLTNLRYLEFSGGISTPNTAHNLSPLAELPKLEELTLHNLHVESEGLRPLASCRRLRHLEVSNQFPTEDYAYLSVMLPDTVCDMFAPSVTLTHPVDGKDVMVVGKRKPFLNSRVDGGRLRKYEAAFRKLQRQYRAEGSRAR